MIEIELLGLARLCLLGNAPSELLTIVLRPAPGLTLRALG